MSPAEVVEGLGFGALIGLALGSLGAGGSILTVPILVYAMGAPVQTATGTSLAIVGLNAFAGALMQLRRRQALPRVGLGVGASGLAGALGGAWLNHQVRGDVVLILFACLMVVVGVGLMRRFPAVVGAPVSAECLTLASWGRIAAVGLGVGVLTGFFGVGGGFLIVPALVLVLGLPMSQAVGTSLIAIAVNALWGLLAHLTFGELDLPLTALFVVGGLLGLVFGGRLASRMPEHQLRLSFGVVVLATAAYTFARSAAALLGTGVA
jgi:uncharacterized membrane protein YfcA